MPALAEGEQGHPPVVLRLVVAWVADVTPAVGGRIHHPGAVIDHHQPQRDAPEHQGQAAGAGGFAKPPQEGRQGELQQQEVAIQPAVVGIGLKIGGQAFDMGLGRHLLEHPAEMAPPQAQVAVVVVAGIVGVEVVVAMQAGPIDRPMLTTEGATGGNEGLQPGHHPKGAVGQQAVKAQGDADAGGEPIEHQQHHQRQGTPEAGQQGPEGQTVDHHHEAHRAPAGAQLAGHDRDHCQALGGGGHAHAIPSTCTPVASMGWQNWRSIRPANRSFKPWCCRKRPGLAGCPPRACICRKVSSNWSRNST